MKFSSVITTLLAVSPLTQAHNLRSQEKTLKTSKVQVVVQGVPQDFSKEDLSVINKSAISAYNAVQEGSRYSLLAMKPILHFGGSDSPLGHCMMCPPDDDTFSLGEEKVLLADVDVLETPISHWCQQCPPDDDAYAGVLDEASSHQLFEETFCNLLAASGSPNLARARDCGFTFLEEPGHAVTPLSLKQHEAKESSHHHGFLSVTGLLHDLSAEDVAIVESATMETFNQAFANVAGYSKFDALKVISASTSSHPVGHCMMCPPDDDTTGLTVTGSVLLLDIDFAAPKKGLGHCRMCPPDDDSVELPSIVGHCMMCPPDDDAVTVNHCMMCPPDDDSVESTPSVRPAVLAFSRALCIKLRNSGSPNLALADDCALDFFYEHKAREESA